METQKQDGFTNEKYIILPTESFEAYLEHPLVKPLYLTDIGFFPDAKFHYRERTEGANEAILIYCVNGKGSIELRDKKIVLEKDALFCIPPYVAHKYYADQTAPWSILWVHFKGDNIGLFPITEMGRKMLANSIESDRMQEYFVKLFNTIESGYSIGNIIHSSQLLSVMLSELYFYEKESQTSKANRYLTKVIDFMYKNIHRELTLEELAKHVNLSKPYLNLIFKQHVNRAPIDFFINLKMQQACRFLKLTEMRIYEISLKLGYEDQYYFSRIFKKTIGLPPKEYRAKK
ncbi:MAG: helix-turn-helix domain-containing protein [Defluviitaleaceae bacterium]|nr:helix-turn-helix domain-containing protein [Defluviitaleaceae bacterium]